MHNYSKDADDELLHFREQRIFLKNTSTKASTKIECTIRSELCYMSKLPVSEIFQFQ